MHKKDIQKQILDKFHKSQHLQSILKENISKNDSDEDGDGDQETAIKAPAKQNEIEKQAQEILDDYEKIREENRKELKKQKKKKKKQQQKPPDEQANKQEDETKERKSDKALQYLKLWKKHRDEWKFKKNLHNWLLKNWKDSDKFPDKRFKIFIKYLHAQNQHSKALERIKCEASKQLENIEAGEQVHERSRSILQWLT